VNIYVAAIRNPLVVDAPRAWRRRAGRTVYVFKKGMKGLYRFEGKLGPRHSNIRFMPVMPFAQCRCRSVHEGSAGDYIFAAVLYFSLKRRAGPVRDDGKPVEASNLFTSNKEARRCM
jgi:hypothetical protein